MQRAVVALVGIVVLAAAAGWYGWNELAAGPPVSVVILPADEVALSPTAHHTFTARVTDARGRVVNAAATWSGDIPIGADGGFEAPDRSGVYFIQAAVGEAKAVAKVTVNPGAPRTLRVLPAAATVKPRDAIAFSAAAFDEWGNAVPVSPVWRVANGTGTIDGQGIFVAGTSGTSTITADVEGLGTSASVATQCVPPRTETGAGLSFTVVCGTFADVWLNGAGLDPAAVTKTVDDAVTAVEGSVGRTLSRRLSVSVFANKANFDLGLKQLYRVDASPFEEGVFVSPAFVAIDWSAPDPPQAVARHEITHLVVAQIARQSVPYWLNEGIATLNEFPVADDTVLISRYCTASAAKNARLPTLSEIATRSGWTAYVDDVGPVSYDVAAQITSFLVDDSNGEANLLDKLALLPVESAYLAASGRSFETFAGELGDRARALAGRYPGIAVTQRARDGSTAWIAYGEPGEARIAVDIRNARYFGGGSTTTNHFGCAVGYLDDSWPRGTYTVTLTGPGGGATATLQR